MQTNQAVKTGTLMMTEAFRAAAVRKAEEKDGQDALVAEIQKYLTPVDRPMFTASGGKEPSSKPRRSPPLQASVAGFGAVKVYPQNGETGKPVESGIYSFATLKPLRHRLQEVRVAYTGMVTDGTRLFRVVQDDILDCAGNDMKPLVVKVQWKDDAPSLVKPHDVNFVFLKPDGSFVQFEVAVVTRMAHGVRGFFLAIQEAWRGWIVETDTGPAFVPAVSANAYPGVDYVKSAVGAELVIGAADWFGAVAKAGSVTPAEWTGAMPELSDELKAQGYKPGVVRWFNASGGYGQVVLKDGTVCFAHMNTLLDEKGESLLTKRLFPLLHPMEQVAVKTKKTQKGLQAEWVRRL